MASLIENKKAYFNYEISDTYEAGVELFGFEVKSLRNHQGSLEGAYVIVRGNEAFLIGANIPAFQIKNAPENFDPLRTRKILLSKKEIDVLSKLDSKKGLTLVAISVYNKGRWMKLSFGVGRGKKKFDKRQTIQKRETDRTIRREFKDR